MTTFSPIERATGDLYPVEGPRPSLITKMIWTGIFDFESNQLENSSFQNAIYSIWISISPFLEQIFSPSKLITMIINFA